MAYVLVKPPATKQCNLCPKPTFVGDLTKHLACVHNKDLPTAKAMNKAETARQHALVRVVYARHLLRHLPPSFGEDAIYSGKDVEDILRMYGHEWVADQPWPRPTGTSVPLSSVPTPQGLDMPAIATPPPAVVTSPSTSQGVTSPPPPAAVSRPCTRQGVTSPPPPPPPPPAAVSRPCTRQGASAPPPSSDT